MAHLWLGARPSGFVCVGGLSPGTGHASCRLHVAAMAPATAKCRVGEPAEPQVGDRQSAGRPWGFGTSSVKVESKMKNIKRGRHDSKCPFCKHLEMQQADQPVGKEASGPLLPLFNKCFLKTVRWGGSRGVNTTSLNSDKNSSIH